MKIIRGGVIPAPRPRTWIGHWDCTHCTAQVQLEGHEENILPSPSSIDELWFKCPFCGVTTTFRRPGHVDASVKRRWWNG